MMDILRSLAAPWGDLGSIAGLLVSAVGFWFTIKGVRRSKAAAQSASAAAEATRDTLLQANAIADFASALAIMEEIRRLQRARAWPILPDRYSSLREKLNASMATEPRLSDEEKATIRTTLDGIRKLERRVEASLAADGAPPNPAKLNQIMASHLDTLQTVVTALRIRIVGDDDDRG